MRIKIHTWLIKNNRPDPSTLIKPGSILEVPAERGRLWLLSGVGSLSKEEPTPLHKAIWNKLMGYLGWQ